MKKHLLMFALLLLATFSVSAGNNEIEKMLKKITRGIKDEKRDNRKSFKI